MKALMLTLMITVALSVFTFGWVGTGIYSYLQGNTGKPHNDRIGVYKEVLQETARLLKNRTLKINDLNNWPLNKSMHIEALDSTEIAFPNEYKNRFNQEQIVIFEDEYRVYLSLLVSNLGIALTLNGPKVQTEESGALSWMLTLMFYLGLTLVALAWLYPLLTRLNALQTVAKRFGQGQLETRVTPKKWSYIADLEKAFNVMANRIEQLVQDNKLLSQAVSHELKTPLARLRFGFDVLADTQAPKKLAKYRKNVDRDLNEMESLVNTLLEYSRLGENTHTPQKQWVTLAALAEETLNTLQSDEKKLYFRAPQKNIEVYFDPHQLQLVLSNLLVNALQYSRCQVSLNLYEVDDTLFFCIEDDGKGIAIQERTKVLKPFVRGAQSAGIKGHGVGLAVVKKILELHGAELEIGASRTLGGAQLTIGIVKPNYRFK